MEQVLTIEAALLFLRNGIAAALTRPIPKTFTPKTFVHSSSLASVIEPIAPTPALLAKISMTSVCLAISLNAAATFEGSDTSQGIKFACVPISPALRSKPNTFAPDSESIRATDRPIPEPAPVTTAVRPLNSVLMLMLHSSSNSRMGI